MASSFCAVAGEQPAPIFDNGLDFILGKTFEEFPADLPKPIFSRACKLKPKPKALNTSVAVLYF